MDLENISHHFSRFGFVLYLTSIFIDISLLRIITGLLGGILYLFVILILSGAMEWILKKFVCTVNYQTVEQLDWCKANLQKSFLRGARHYHTLYMTKTDYTAFKLRWE